MPILQYYRYLFLIDWDCSGLFCIYLFNSVWTACVVLQNQIDLSSPSMLPFSSLWCLSAWQLSVFFASGGSWKVSFFYCIFKLWVRLCLMCGNMLVQEQGQVISENTATPWPPQRYFRQLLQGILKVKKKKASISWFTWTNRGYLTVLSLS